MLDNLYKNYVNANALCNQCVPVHLFPEAAVHSVRRTRLEASLGTSNQNVMQKSQLGVTACFGNQGLFEAVNPPGVVSRVQ
jgi:hypothetical protein